MMNLTLGNEDNDDSPSMIEERKSEQDDDEDYANNWVDIHQEQTRIVAFEPLDNTLRVQPNREHDQSA